MLKKIIKNQIIYEVDWDEIYSNTIAPYLKSRYDLEFNDDVRIRITNLSGAMVKPNHLQFKLPETLLEED